MSVQNKRKRISKHRQRVIESINSDNITKCEKEILGKDIVVLPRQKDAIWTHHAKERFKERKPEEGKKLVKRYAGNVITTVFYRKEYKKRKYVNKRKQAKIEEDKKYKQKLGKGKNKSK